MEGRFRYEIFSLLFIVIVATSCSSSEINRIEGQDSNYNNERSMYVSDYLDRRSEDHTDILQRLVDQANVTGADLFIDSDIAITHSIRIEGISDLSIRFVNSGSLKQTGIPTGKQSSQVGSGFYAALRIIDSKNIQIFDAKITGENPDGFILARGGEAAAISIESTGFDEDGEPLTRDIHIIRPRFHRIIGTGVRSFAGQRVSNVHISDGVFSNLAKTGVNCCAEGLIVTNCEMTRCKTGLEVAMSSHCIIANNKITYCAHSGIAVGGFYNSSTKRDGSLPFQLEEMKQRSERQLAVKVVNNFVYKCGAGLDFSSSEGPGISVTIGTTYPIISNNHIYFSGRSGIQVAQSIMPSNPVLLPLIHSNVLVSNGHRDNTEPSAGIFSLCPIIAHDNFIDNRSPHSIYVPTYGIYISLRHYKENGYFGEDDVSIYNNHVIHNEKRGIAVYLKEGTKDYNKQNRIRDRND